MKLEVLYSRVQKGLEQRKCPVYVGIPERRFGSDPNEERFPLTTDCQILQRALLATDLKVHTVLSRMHFSTRQ